MSTEPPTGVPAPDHRPTTWQERAERLAVVALFAFVVAVQFSIFAAQLLLTLAALGWAGTLWLRHERPAVPPIFWPLAAYAAATLVSVAFSLAPEESLRDSKQLVLFLIVPIVYRFATGRRASELMWVIITAGAFSAIYGIIQYGVLQYNVLSLRPRGSLGHWMTYSGVLMLVLGLAVSRVLFQRQDRTWPLLVMPALVVALVLTFTRSAWVGASVAVGLLLLLKDFRLIALLPVALALLFGLAPGQLTSRFYSIFDPRDPTSRDRVSMIKAGLRMVRDHPLTGVGPNVVERLYPRYREPDAVEPNQPHLHNVPVQIAAERGLPALVVWIGFVGVLVGQLSRLFLASRSIGSMAGGPAVTRSRVLAAGGLAAAAAMLAAGMFEYNFGDSEFLMLFLVVVTLPFTGERTGAPGEGPASALVPP